MVCHSDRQYLHHSLLPAIIDFLSQSNENFYRHLHQKNLDVPFWQIYQQVFEIVFFVSIVLYHHCCVSEGIRVRIPQKLDVLAFWSWNLDVVVFQPWNLDVVAFCPLKKCLGITMPWVNCLRFSMSWLFRLGISMSCICVSTASFSFSSNLLCHIINVDM